jgi:hypothetical protein
VLDSFPLDLPLPCYSNSQGYQRNKSPPMSATEIKYHSYDTASVNYKSLQHRSLLIVRDYDITRISLGHHRPHSKIISSELICHRQAYTTLLTKHKCYKTVMMDYYTLLRITRYTLCILNVRWTKAQSTWTVSCCSFSSMNRESLKIQCWEK